MKNNEVIKIIFICGALEPGRDGVGDYIRIIAAELLNKGHHCTMIALNDMHLENIFEGSQTLLNNNIHVLRLPSNLSWEKRINLAKASIDHIKPDWLSLQYVPFAFDPKGLPFRLASHLKKIGGTIKWHVMFHELWVGMSKQSSLKELAWGLAQRHLTKRLIDRIKPVVVHTHTELYKKHIGKFGIKCTLLPLPTNLPVLDPERVVQKMRNWPVNHNQIDIVIFGGIHAGAPVSQFAQEAADYQKNRKSFLNLIIIGKKSIEQQHWIDVWKSFGLKVTHMGQLSEEQVSETLTDICFGIFTTPLVLVEKSSAVATMWAHGVNLLCVSRAWDAKGIDKLSGNPYHFDQYKEGGLSDFIEKRPDFSYMPSVPEVAQQLMSNLINLE
jgi:hypothetical protein